MLGMMKTGGGWLTTCLLSLVSIAVVSYQYLDAGPVLGAVQSINHCRGFQPDRVFAYTARSAPLSLGLGGRDFSRSIDFFTAANSSRIWLTMSRTSSRASL